MSLFTPSLAARLSKHNTLSGSLDWEDTIVSFFPGSHLKEPASQELGGRCPKLTWHPCGHSLPSQSLVWQVKNALSRGAGSQLLLSVPTGLWIAEKGAYLGKMFKTPQSCDKGSICCHFCCLKMWVDIHITDRGLGGPPQAGDRHRSTQPHLKRVAWGEVD